MALRALVAAVPVVAGGGCSSITGGQVKPYVASDRGAVVRREAAARSASVPSGPVGPTASRPARGFGLPVAVEMAASPATQPVEADPTSRPATRPSASETETSTRPAAAGGSPKPPASGPAVAGGGPAPPAASQPVEPAVGTVHAPTVPGHPGDQAGQEVYTLNPLTITRLVFDVSPQVRAAREEMTAAQHALTEFRTNLSRLEPFVETKADMVRYPARRDAEGITGEIVGGIEKETYDGAVLRVEGGASGSRFRFGEVQAGQEELEEGSGGLVRARVEVPFIGSRKRQQRVISAAFQESQARKAQLDYFRDYRSYVIQALGEYYAALLYLNYARVWEWKVRMMESLMNHPRMRPEDRDRLVSSVASAKVLIDNNMSSYESYCTQLLASLGLPLESAFVLEEQPYAPSRYVERSGTAEGEAAMLEQAFQNNPRFRVLNDAIRDAELQRRQAILGRYDITAYVQGTHHPFGAVSYDDRLDGWEVAGGVKVRLNDQRVLTATRLKAEAQIRQYEAEIEAERLRIQRTIRNNVQTLRDNHLLRLQQLEVCEQKRAEYERRTKIYLEGGDPPMSIDDVLAPLNEWTSARIQLEADRYYAGLAEMRMMADMGEVYTLVGLDISSLAEAAPARPAGAAP